MDSVGAILFRVIATMTILLFIWWVGGQRRLSELRPFGFVTIVVGATIAGTVIADPNIELGAALIALAVLGIIQVCVDWLFIKKRSVFAAVNHKPTIVIQDGQIIKENLLKLRLSVETLLQLLRQNSIFNINEVDIAIVEPLGGLSILKKPEYQPLTPSQLKMTVAANKILIPVILEGQLQEQALHSLGFSVDQIAAFKRQNEAELHKVFIAFMDQEHQLHVVHHDACSDNLFLH
ncbi:DUF421 domain-containing protein [bacterium BFN5]|nr:DUF421 domain-containing protein [bacterium BFN5]QJW47587.1 DUF421 domain-containing protein [bacterium BFN5]